MNSINTQLSPFETLPLGVIGNVLHQLNQVTGKNSFSNETNIPIIFKYATNLAGVSKRMATNINDQEALYIFLESLSNMFGESKAANFPVNINTKASQDWLWSYIQRNGDAESYRAIQDIYELASNVLIEAKNSGLCFRISDGRKTWPRPNPLFSQTKQGFALDIEIAPEGLWTPFGKITLYSGYLRDDGLSISELFIKKLNAEFVNIGVCKYRNSFYELQSSESDIIREIKVSDMKIISEEEVNTKKGTSNFIFDTSPFARSLYKIRGVKGRKLPEIVPYDVGDFMRSSYLIQKIWDMLEANRFGTSSY